MVQIEIQGKPEPAYVAVWHWDSHGNGQVVSWLDKRWFPSGYDLPGEPGPPIHVNESLITIGTPPSIL